MKRFDSKTINFTTHPEFLKSVNGPSLTRSRVTRAFKKDSYRENVLVLSTKTIVTRVIFDKKNIIQNTTYLEF